MTFKDHFSTQASGYAKARPTYPKQLFLELARLASGHTLAWDAGSGNGQAAVALGELFEGVVATEPSSAQLAEAVAHPRVAYFQAAEKAPMLKDASVDLVTAAQAAHWFDRASYYEEIRRVAKPGALVALWTYALCEITPEIDRAIYRFYAEVVGPYWPPERSHCITGYREFAFPFAEIPFPKVIMALDWQFDDLIGYLATWSAVAGYRKDRGQDPIPELRAELDRIWGAPSATRKVTWPLEGRAGYVR